jgi:DNA-damage-inducible protein J
MNKVISVKVDEKTKEAAREVAKSMGISLSTLINAYLKQVVVTRRVELFAPEQMTPKLEGLIESIEQDIAKGKISKGYNDPKSFLRSLKK